MISTVRWSCIGRDREPWRKDGTQTAASASWLLSGHSNCSSIFSSSGLWTSIENAIYSAFTAGAV